MKKLQIFDSRVFGVGVSNSTQDKLCPFGDTLGLGCVSDTMGLSGGLGTYILGWIFRISKRAHSFFVSPGLAFELQNEHSLASRSFATAARLSVAPGNLRLFSSAAFLRSGAVERGRSELALFARNRVWERSVVLGEPNTSRCLDLQYRYKE